MKVITLIILAELLRLYILGLIAMALFGLFAGVSWASIAIATSWWQVAIVPLYAGMLVGFAISTGRVTARATKRIAARVSNARATKRIAARVSTARITRRITSWI